jgi:hypothetical protein
MKTTTWYTHTLSGYQLSHRVHQCTPKEQSGGKTIQPGIGNTPEATLGNLPLLLAMGVKDKVKGLRLADFASGNKKE